MAVSDHLHRYQPGDFEKLHACGSRILTASQVPALFGASRWSSKFAVFAHVAGHAALPDVDSPLMERGRVIEPYALVKLAHHTGESVRPAGGYAWHPSLPCIASPDGLIGDEGIVEVKTISPQTFRDRWGGHDGEPPIDVQLQHQTQYACCKEATRGFITAAVVGDRTFEFAHFPTKPHRGAIARIEREVAATMAMIERGEMPEPDDESRSTAAALEAMFKPNDEVTVSLQDAEAIEIFDRWMQAKANRKAAEADEETYQLWFLTRIGDAARVAIGNRRAITRRVVKRKEFTVKAGESVRWTLKEIGERA